MPALVALAVMLTEASQRRGRKDELATLATVTEEIAPEYAENALVQALLPEVKATVTSGEMKEYAKAKQTDKALTVALQWSAQINDLLAHKSTPVETEGYKRFVLHTGYQVAAASADAEFLGIGGATISLGERKTLLSLVDALQVDFDY